jgi:hypothetical protein
VAAGAANIEAKLRHRYEIRNSTDDRGGRNGDEFVYGSRCGHYGNWDAEQDAEAGADTRDAETLSGGVPPEGR